MSDITLAALLPHQAPMLLLDRLLEYQGNRVRCETRVGERQALLLDEQGNLPAWVGLELMAQTIAAWAGMRGRERGEPVRIGMLLGSRQYQCQLARFAAGECLVIEAECLLEDNGMASFECRIGNGEQRYAEARLSTYLPSEAELKALLG
ncbi:hotdog family protein [Aeromonas veronii]|uniref:hotdog family protein n=1 Tax=Aeromonas TaxID=642 RepID=UPI0032ED8C8A